MLAGGRPSELAPQDRTAAFLLGIGWPNWQRAQPTRAQAPDRERRAAGILSSIV